MTNLSEDWNKFTNVVNPPQKKNGVSLEFSELRELISQMFYSRGARYPIGKYDILANRFLTFRNDILGGLF